MAKLQIPIPEMVTLTLRRDPPVPPGKRWVRIMPGLVGIVVARSPDGKVVRVKARMDRVTNALRQNDAYVRTHIFPMVDEATQRRWEAEVERWYKSLNSWVDTVARNGIE